ncbi:MAG: Glu-tRNA(Gln) amidotransferase subunit GatD [Candidatus Ranarchaeia archaeon]
MELQDDSIMGYKGLILDIFQKNKIKVGDRIVTNLGSERIEGIIIPRTQISSDSNHIVLKLDNGYNIGIRINSNVTIKKIGKGRLVKPELPNIKLNQNPNLPLISILSTGGTIASRVDYKTGAVISALSARDLYNVVPELSDIVNIRAEILENIFSENMNPGIWSRLVKKIDTHIKNQVDGIIIAHGTDTLHFTASALAFACRDLPIPVCLVGSQRSSDRPSSDASVNLLSAAKFVSDSQFSGISLLMHKDSSDNVVEVHSATKVRKCHTSKRDAFRTINGKSIALIKKNEEIDYLSNDFKKRNKNRKPTFYPDFDPDVAIIKTYPGMKYNIIDSYIENGIHGLIIEGTGLGHTPHSLYAGIKKAQEREIPIVITSQCIWGRTNMRVYSTGVELLGMGVIEGKDMLTETAFTKLSWTLGQTNKIDKIKEIMLENLVGEFSDRSLNNNNSSLEN